MPDFRLPTLDTFVWQPSVTAQQNTPPGSPSAGDRYLVGVAPTGAWQGHANAIAEWSGSAWEFTAAAAGMVVWVQNTDALKQFGTSWVNLPKAHAATHQNGGSDEISVAGLSGVLADAQTPIAHAASHEDGGADEISITDLTDNDTYCAVVKAGLNVSGGGVVSWIANKFKWTYRFIVISHGRGSHFSTSGYFDITMPTSGTCTGVGGAADAAWGADGITLTSWQALYYILPVGSGSGSAPANFRIASYTSNMIVPEDWILLAVINGDSASVIHCQVCNGMRLVAGDSQQPGGDLPVSMGGTGASDAATARTNLGVAIGGDVQAYDATLTSLAAVAGVQGDLLYAPGTDTWTRLPKSSTANSFLKNSGTNNNPAWSVLAPSDMPFSATDKLLGRSSAGAGGGEEITCTAAGRALLDDASAAAQRTTLGLDTDDNVSFGEVVSGDLVTLMWQIPGNNLYVGDAQSCSPLIVPFPVTFLRARAAVVTAPTGAAIKFQLTRNGANVFDESPDLRLQIAAGATSGTATDFTGGLSTAVAGDLLNINVDQVGSTVAGGGGCCVMLVCKKTGTHG